MVSLKISKDFRNFSKLKFATKTVTPSETGPVGTTGNEHVPPRTSKTELDTLAHFRRHAQKAGFQKGLQIMAVKFLKIGTRDTYDSLLHRFYKLCPESQTDPASASLGN